MSLAINPDLVSAVMIGNKWFPVYKDSFDLDSYEFVIPSESKADNDFIMHGGGNSGVCATGFRFQLANDLGVIMSGPLTAIQAVQYTHHEVKD